MMAALMLYGLVVGACVAVAALAAERIAKLLRRPLRWIWVAALVTIVGLMGAVPMRRVSIGEDPLDRCAASVSRGEAEVRGKTDCRSPRLAASPREFDLPALDRSSIASVEVLKGALARQRYPEPAAANGVIVITTRK